mgnify:CR=1 FL=1
MAFTPLQVKFLYTIPGMEFIVKDVTPSFIPKCCLTSLICVGALFLQIELMSKYIHMWT